MALLLRFSGPAIALGAVLIIVTVSFGHGIGPLYLAGVALLVLGMAGQVLRARRQRPTKEREPLLIEAPVTGRCRDLNSSASKVPSHMNGLAQTYALDITHEPPGASPRAMGWLWPLMRRPQEFPSFGRPVLAPSGGTASGSAGGSADGPAPDVPPDGTVVAVLAHLRCGSLQVAPGKHVTADQQLAECGNSGNSSDPHVHFQLMDGTDLTTAHGLPFEWEYLGEDGAPRRGVPANEELFVVEE